MTIVQKMKENTSCCFYLPFICITLSLFITVESYAKAVNSQSDKKKNTKERTFQMEEVIVTAEKRAQNIEKIPASITALDSVLIEDAEIQDMDDVATFTPGLEFRNAGSRRHGFSFMRGIKNIHAAEPAMGYYVDGVSFSKSYMFDFPLFDVERIEVLKGPQGTLYGKNSMAGVINVVTTEPGNSTKGKVSANIGTDNLWEFESDLSGAVVEDTLFLGASFLLKRRDGYMENDVNTERGRYTEGEGGRIKLKYLPSGNLDITLSIDGQTWDDGVFPLRLTKRNPLVKKGIFTADRDYHYSHDFNGSSDTDFWGSSLNINYDFQKVVLTSITGYRDYHVDEFLDSDFSSLDMTRMQYDQKDRDFSQEFCLASSEDKQVFSWLTGLYYFTNDSDNETTTYYRSKMIGKPLNPFGDATGSRLNVSKGTNTGAALFGQGTCSFNNSLALTLGLRYEYEHAEMDWYQRDTPTNGVAAYVDFPSKSDDFTSLLPKASLAWHFTDNDMVYVTFSGGHRGGGFNKLSSAYNASYNEEMNWLYEVGTKFNFPAQTMTINLSAFYMDIEDEQIVKFDPDLNSPYTVNAGKSHRTGLEAELYISLLTGWDINIGFTAIDAEYDEYSDPIRRIDYAGNQVFNVPNLSGNIGVQYRCSIYNKWSFMGRVDLSVTGKRYLDDANTVEEDPYALVNTKIGVEREHVDVYFWVKNLFNEHYVIFENTTKGIAEDGSPIMGGITFKYRL